MMHRDELVPFGWSRAARAGLSFRTASEADLPFLARVFNSTRLEELAPVPWIDEQKAAFLAMQFRAQHLDYQRNHPHADRLVLVYAGADIGRLYLGRGQQQYSIIDIALLPEFRGKGLGSALLLDILEEAGREGRSVAIHVEKHNPARGLYQRLGFTTEQEGPVYDLMRWVPPSVASPSANAARA